MTAAVLINDLERLGVRLRAKNGSLVVDAPRGVLTEHIKAELAACKPELLRLVRSQRSFIEFAAARLPVIRLTIRETGDTQRDFGLLGHVRQVIGEFQPGGNHVYLTIVTLDGRRVKVEWRALAEHELRIALGRILARAASNEAADEDHAP